MSLSVKIEFNRWTKSLFVSLVFTSNNPSLECLSIVDGGLSSITNHLDRHSVNSGCAEVYKEGCVSVPNEKTR